MHLWWDLLKRNPSHVPTMLVAVVVSSKCLLLNISLSILQSRLTCWISRTSKPAGFDSALPPNMLRNISKTMGIIPRAATDQKWAMAIEVTNAINRASWARVFFVTASGYIGIGPLGTQHYDEVYKFLGAQVPFKVRRREGVPERYQLLGECYVHSFIDGELWEKQWWWNNDLDVDEMKGHLRKIVFV